MLRLVNESQNRFPGEKLSLCGQLTAFIFVYSALWNRHVKLRPPMFAHCLLHRLQVDVQKSTLNQRSYIWILVWTLREDVQLACVNTPGLFFGLHVPVMTHRIRQIKSKAIVVSC